MDVSGNTANEKRMIDADALRQEIERIYLKHFAKSREKFVQDTFNAMFKRIDNAKTVDAVEVVRCKDCKYYCQDKINGVICRHPALDFDTECFDHWINTNPDDFCSYGERKGGAE